MDSEPNPTHSGAYDRSTLAWMQLLKGERRKEALLTLRRRDFASRIRARATLRQQETAASAAVALQARRDALRVRARKGMPKADFLREYGTLCNDALLEYEARPEREAEATAFYETDAFRELSVLYDRLKDSPARNRRRLTRLLDGWRNGPRRSLTTARISRAPRPQRRSGATRAAATADDGPESGDSDPPALAALAAPPLPDSLVLHRVPETGAAGRPAPDPSYEQALDALIECLADVWIAEEGRR